MGLLGYEKWERFDGAIKRAMQACQQTGNIVTDHFPLSEKKVTLGSGATRKIKDYNLSRFACYLIARAPVKGPILRGVKALFLVDKGTAQRLT
jgi:DNA-damage-inducible protein D